MSFETPNINQVPVPKQDPREHPKNVTEKQDAITDHTEEQLGKLETQLTASNLSKLQEVSRSDALVLAKKVLWLKGKVDIPTAKKKIEAYQKDHNIDADGKIGKETYMEMFAWKALESASDRIDSLGISEKTQKKIIFVLENATLTWTNTIALIALLNNFREKHKSDNGFQAKYGNLFTQLDETGKKFVESSKGKEAKAKATKALETKNDHGSSVWADIAKVIEGDLAPWEFFKRNKGPLVLAAIIGFVFFGNEIPGINKLPGTGSLFGRIGWLIGGALLWADDLIGYGIEKAVKTGENIDVTPLWKWFQKGVKNTQEALKSEVPSDIWESTSGYFKELSESFITSAASLNEGYKNATDKKEKAKYIEPKKFQVLGDKVLGDTNFMKTSKTKLQNIKTLSQLNTYLGDEAKKELKKVGVEDKDVNNFIKLHVLPQLVDQGDSFFESWKQKILGYANETQAAVKSEYIANDKLNSIIVTEISTLTQTGSEKVKAKAKEIQQAILLGEGESYKLDTVSLSAKEKKDLSFALKKIQFVLKQEASVQKQIREIQDISLLPAWGLEEENQKTLTHKLQELDQIKIALTVPAQYNIPDWDFSLKEFFIAFREKELEILTAMKGLWMLVFERNTDEINIEDWILASENEKKEEIIDERVSELKTKINEVPSVDSTPLEMRKWYENTSPVFSELEDIQAEAISQDLKREIVTMLESKEDFTENYTSVREKYISEFAAIKERIASIPEWEDINSITLLERKKLIFKYFKELQSPTNDVIEGIEDIWWDTKRFFSIEAIIPEENNSILDLDARLGIDTDQWFSYQEIISELNAKVEKIEQDFDVSVDVENLDVTTSREVVKIVSQMQKNEGVVASFANEEVQSLKYEEIAKYASSIEEKYLHEMNTLNSLGDIASLHANYERDFKWKFGNSLYTAWAGLKGIFVTQDAVSIAYEKNKAALQESVKQAEIDEKLKKLEVSVSEFESTPASFLKEALIQDGFSFPANGYNLKIQLEIYALRQSDKKKINIQETIEFLESAIR